MALPDIYDLERAAENCRSKFGNSSATSQRVKFAISITESASTATSGHRGNLGRIFGEPDAD
jgi:hypothetical protein